MAISTGPIPQFGNVRGNFHVREVANRGGHWAILMPNSPQLFYGGVTVPALESELQDGFDDKTRSMRLRSLDKLVVEIRHKGEERILRPLVEELVISKLIIVMPARVADELKSTLHECHLVSRVELSDERLTAVPGISVTRILERLMVRRSQPRQADELIVSRR